MILLAEWNWRHTWVVSQCPEQLPQAMFQCCAFGCFTASLWALISFQTAGVLTNQAFHVSLSFTLFCFTIHTWTPKRMDKILSFSEAINDQQLTWLKWVLCLTSSILRLTIGRMVWREMNYLFNFFIVYHAVCDFPNQLHRRLDKYVCTLLEMWWNVHPGRTDSIANYLKLLIVTREEAKNTKYAWIPDFVPLLPHWMRLFCFHVIPWCQEGQTLTCSLIAGC